MRVGTIVIGAGLLLTSGACSAGADSEGEPPPSTTQAPAGDGGSRGIAPNCTSDTGIDFTTAFASCDEAVERGRLIAFNAGQVTGADMPAADTAFAVTCMAIQGDTPMTATAESIEMAEVLDATGVCPGDLDQLTQSTP
jgi:hypothetical protein